MNEKRTAIAVLLSLAVIMIYSEMIMDPYIRDGQAARAVAAAKAAEAAVAPTPVMGVASLNATATKTASSSASSSLQNAIVNNAATNTAALSDSASQPLRLFRELVSPSLSDVDAAGTVLLENESIKIHLSKLGGRVRHYELKFFSKELNKEPLVDLVHAHDGSGLPLALRIGEFSDAGILYKPEFGADGRSVVLRADETQAGVTIAKHISVDEFGYGVQVDAKVGGTDQPLALEWTHYVAHNDANVRLNPVSFKVMSAEDKLSNTPADSLGTMQELIVNPKWIGFGDRYFLATLIGATATGNGQRIVQAQSDGSHLYAIRITNGAPYAISGMLYGGPKKAELLAEVRPGLERTIDLGWFSFLAFPLLAFLKLLNVGLENWGLSIVALTLVLKALFLPLTKASFQSMKAMQVVAPEMKALRERIQDPQVLQQEMLKLYQKHKVNPLGGCVPILLQIPVFIGLYNVLLNAVELRHAPFALWIQDLSSPESLMIAGIPVPLMVIFLGVSMFLQQYFTPSAGMDPTQRKVFLLMPVILTLSFLIYPLPAGLVLYWVVNNSISIVQQVLLKSDYRVGPYRGTAIAGVAMFAIAYALTKI